jgi:SPW repeat
MNPTTSTSARGRYDVLVDEINLVLGAFLFFTPWIFDFWQTSPEKESILGPLDAWACSAAIGLTAGASIVEFSEWRAWLNFTIGQWVALAPWLLGFSANASVRWAHLIVGLTVSALAAFRLCLTEHRAQAFDSGPIADRTSWGAVDATGHSGFDRQRSGVPSNVVVLDRARVARSKRDQQSAGKRSELARNTAIHAKSATHRSQLTAESGKPCTDPSGRGFGPSRCSH